MGKFLFFLTLAIFGLVLISSGCTESTDKTYSGTQTGDVAQPSQVQESSQTVFSLIPTATDSMPSNLIFSVDASKDPISGAITVISRGGAGQNLAENLNIKVYLSTGKIVEENISPDVNSEFVCDEGTKGEDRVVVVVSLQNGESYKIYDDVLDYRK